MGLCLGVKEFNLSYQNKETLSFTIDPYYANTLKLNSPTRAQSLTSDFSFAVWSSRPGLTQRVHIHNNDGIRSPIP